MDIVEINPRQATLFTAIATWLGNNIREATREEIQRYTRHVIQQLQHEGRNQITNLQQGLQQVAQEAARHGQAIGRGFVRAATRDIQAIQRRIQGEQGEIEEWTIDQDMSNALDEANNEALSLFNSPEDEQVPDVSDLMPNEDALQPNTSEALRANASTGGGPNPVSKETPITLAKPSYGLQETHTTILPFNFWFSAVNANYSGDLKMQFRTNAIDDMVITPLSTVAAGGVWSRGVYNVPFNNNGVRGSNPATFPRTQVNGGPTNEAAFWATYWKRIYEYYTVLGCEYKIIIRNPQSNTPNRDMLVMTNLDSYSDTAGTTGNITPDATLAEMLAFKNMTTYRVIGEPTSTFNPQVQIITGVVKPGQIKRNISNDGDVKTWTKTDGSLPTLKEIFTMRFFNHPLNHGDTNTLGNNAGCNVQVELKYLVQFKDLKEAARYPYTTNAVTITQSLPVHAIDN